MLVRHGRYLIEYDRDTLRPIAPDVPALPLVPTGERCAKCGAPMVELAVFLGMGTPELSACPNAECAWVHPRQPPEPTRRGPRE